MFIPCIPLNLKKRVLHIFFIKSKRYFLASGACPWGGSMGLFSNFLLNAKKKGIPLVLCTFDLIYQIKDLIKEKKNKEN